jgi:hypothetical protein
MADLPPRRWQVLQGLIASEKKHYRKQRAYVAGSTTSDHFRCAQIAAVLLHRLGWQDWGQLQKLWLASSIDAQHRVVRD